MLREGQAMTAIHETWGVDVLSDDDVAGVVQDALTPLGLTFGQLADQARARRFESIEARLVWLAIGELFRG